MSHDGTRLGAGRRGWWPPHGRPIYGSGVSGLRAVGVLACCAAVLLTGSGAAAAPVAPGPLDPAAFHGLVPPPGPYVRLAAEPGNRDLAMPTARRPHAKSGAVALRLTQPQLRSVWCAPAAGRAALSAVMPRPPGQTWLATAMGTGGQGTLMSAIAPALNRAQRRNRYQLDFATSPRVLLTRVRMDVERYRSAVIIGVDPGQLPWYEGLLPLGGGHALVVHGYSVTPAGGALLVWDPARSPLAGRHTTSSSALTAAGVRFGGAIVW